MSGRNGASTKHGRSPNSRAVAAGIIRRWLESGGFPDRLMDEVTRDRAFVMEVVYGVVKRRRQLEWMLRRTVKRMPADALLAFLLVGLYQLVHMPDVEIYAVVNETVAAVKREFSQDQADFTNAVLRGVIRDKDQILAELQSQPLAIRESHPSLLVERWTGRFGAEAVARLCAWNNQPAEVVLRVNGLKTRMPEFLQRLASAGIAAQPHAFAPDQCCVLPRGVSVADVPGYGEGLFNVQDPSTLAAVDLLAPRPGEIILDACAAPGGKTMAITERMESRGELVAMDLHLDRLRRLQANLRRMGLDFVRTLHGDIAAGVPDLAEKRFDAILLDVPCTNTGVLRRRPDARWRFSRERLGQLCVTQQSFLEAAAQKVRPGGRLAYSTCSLEPEENEDLVGGWLAGRPDFKLVSQRRLFPPDDLVDGVYAALLRRTPTEAH